ncbi:MAG: aldo/keto reductase [Caulobacteraceae bacterium]
MRFRPFGGSGVAVSSVSLALQDPKGKMKAADWARLVVRAMESGVNAFEIVEPTQAVLEGLAQALPTVERRLVFVGWRCGFTPMQAARSMEFMQGLERTANLANIGYLDLVLFDEPAGEPTAGDIAEAMSHFAPLRDERRVRLFGVRGDGESIDACIQSAAFDAVAMSYNLTSGWRERLRMKEASRRDIAVIGLEPYPEMMKTAVKDDGKAAKRSSIWRRASDPLSGSGSYAFMERTPGWTGEEISLSWVLTEPALATVQVTAHEEKRMSALAEVPERDMPSGVAAQIEMARFSPAPVQGDRRRAG